MTDTARWWDNRETSPTLTARAVNQLMPDKGQLFALLHFVTPNEETDDKEEPQHPQQSR